mmetsp:Transcript_4682/g.5216  ORF Transcript_4682/g.5216 Transcript_4682/m.5216 type:complete len:562 (+) Transcript_4682:120-1805(+)|eukprot:CAMPEP_0194378892 /NCGR_PEP_ID=MMETSP0174-20130528/37164_1 /TAXON_ID=216777 /ORGANISM="Proboscia alata, Strain PI-D3" /LENGTH=561 /DNA_ID=CAMNT_0039161211 /DNA_START=110 /DNA_END=1795 /DNA_ORIENTATION=-
MSEKKTIIDHFLLHTAKAPNRVLFTQPMGGDIKNVKDHTAEQVLIEAKRMAAYIESLNFEKGSKIAICSKNCTWWIIADLAIWFSGHVSVPIYPTLTGETVRYTLDHSEAKLLFVGKLDTKPWEAMKTGVPDDLPTVSFPMCPEGGDHKKWDDIISEFEPMADIAKRTMEEMATIIYTSGSTGKPKGVMHSFETMTVPTEGLVKLLNITSSDRYISYLPLAHGMERWSAQCVVMMTANHIYFADSLATFKDDLTRAQPTIFLSVPRLWTKFQQAVSQKIPDEKMKKLLKIPVISWIIKRKILKTLGLSHARFAGSGSAPLPAPLLQWYRNLGLELLEGYGMTENFNYSHINMPGKTRAGYVGHHYDDVEHRLSEEGEIQMKGPGIMLGYYKNEEATKEVIMDDGFLRTGDRGSIDEQGRLMITGRTKEIFKTSKGKYVAPAPIENKLIVSPSIELACVSGVGFPQPHAVIHLGDDAKISAGTPTGKVAIEKELEELIKSANSTLDGHEHLQFLVIVNDVWTPENGFLTPTQKIKRGTIEDAYSGNNEEFYGAKKAVLWHGW